ncbi:hypothetical protein [Skermanella stibiiresistens]|nr:hypothetical protein [Skermanella stibiiresistens]
MDDVPSRRDVLRIAGGISAAVAVISIAGPASAFQYLPAEDYAGVIEDSCGASNKVHGAMVAEVERELGVTLDDSQARQLIAAVTCPLCGCSILQGFTDAARAPFDRTHPLAFLSFPRILIFSDKVSRSEVILVVAQDHERRNLRMGMR